MRDATRITSFLDAEGFTSPKAQQAARQLLEAEKLTHAGKQALANEKLDRARQLLHDSFLCYCGDAGCLALAPRDNRQPIEVTGSACEICGGSNNRRAAELLVKRLAGLQISRLLVLGGTATQHAELTKLLPGLELRCIDGASGKQTKRDATTNLEWAQVLVVWGATPLPHKVSRLYTADPPPHVRVVKFAKRGIESLCSEVLKSFSS